MALTITHTKVSAIPDDADTSLIRPSDWNADHSLTGVATPAQGGTGVGTLTGIVKGNGTGNMTAATGAEIVAAIGATAVANATNATTATNATNANYANSAGSAGSAGSTGTINGASAGTVYGDFTATGNVTAFSDETLKKDWDSLPADFVTLLAELKSGTYTRIDSGDRQAGVSAQSLQAFLKECVMEDADGILSVAYGNAALVSCVELAKAVEELKKEIEILKNK